MIDLILGQATITTTLELNLPLSALPVPTMAPAATGAGHEPGRLPVPGGRRRAPAVPAGANVPRPGPVGVAVGCCRGSGSRRPGSG